MWAQRACSIPCLPAWPAAGHCRLTNLPSIPLSVPAWGWRHLLGASHRVSRQRATASVPQNSITDEAPPAKATQGLLFATLGTLAEQRVLQRTLGSVGDAAAGRDVSALPAATAGRALPTPRSWWDGQEGQRDLAQLCLSLLQHTLRAALTGVKMWEIPGGQEGALRILKLKGWKTVLHEQQGADWPTAQFRWLLFPTEELSSTGNQTVTLCKTCMWLLIASQKARSNPAPCTPEHKLMKSMYAANKEGFPPHGCCSRGSWDVTLGRQDPSCQVPTWPELVALPSTGSNARSVFLAAAVLCWEVLISLAGC